MIEKLIAAFLALFHQAPLSSEDAGLALDKRAAELGGGLSPRTSIVDLLKTLGMDSSLSARGVLWRDLGHTDPYQGTAEQNTELHRVVMVKVAARGIKL